MAFTVSDFEDLKQLLILHPDWRTQLRQLLLTEDFEALPGIVRDLAEAQRRTEARVEELAEAQRRTEARVEELVEAQRRTDERLTRLEYRVDKIDIRLARVDGRTLEMEYREKATAYFGRWIRRGEVVRVSDVWELVEDRVSADELQEVLRTDLIVRGRLIRSLDRPEVWLAVEVSCVVDRDDVQRAERRADILRRAGLTAIPVVAGLDATDGAETEAKARHVAMLQNGTGLFWDEAIVACT